MIVVAAVVRWLFPTDHTGEEGPCVSYFIVYDMYLSSNWKLIGQFDIYRLNGIVVLPVHQSEAKQKQIGIPGAPRRKEPKWIPPW
jgi:hypothetical protein